MAPVSPFGNRGDTDDLFPDIINEVSRKTRGKTTRPALNLQGGIFSGVSIKIKEVAGAATMGIDVVIG